MTDLSREYGDGLYALCAEEGIAKEVLEQLQALKACFDEQPEKACSAPRSHRIFRKLST